MLAVLWVDKGSEQRLALVNALALGNSTEPKDEIRLSPIHNSLSCLNVLF